jgi:hypothetical protein
MRRLGFVVLFAVGACGSGSNNVGLITAHWSFTTVAGAATNVCPVGSATVTVTATNTVTSQQLIDLYDCPNNTGTSSYPAGIWDVTIDVQGYGSATFVEGVERFPSQIVDITSVDADVTASPLLDDGGFFQVAWKLQDATTQAPLDCVGAGNPDSIQIASTLSGTSTMLKDKFTCSKGAGLTDPLLQGSYTISLSALNAAGQPLGASVMSTNQTITNRNGTTDLGTITIPIN